MKISPKTPRSLSTHIYSLLSSLGSSDDAIFLIKSLQGLLISYPIKYKLLGLVFNLLCKNMPSITYQPDLLSQIEVITIP